LKSCTSGSQGGGWKRTLQRATRWPPTCAQRGAIIVIKEDAIEVEWLKQRLTLTRKT
jgi:hypothetical protein